MNLVERAAGAPDCVDRSECQTAPGGYDVNASVFSSHPDRHDKGGGMNPMAHASV